MSIVDLKNNIAESKKVINEIKMLQKALKSAEQKDKNFYQASITSLYNRLIILNSAVSGILNTISATKPLGAGEANKSSGVASFKYNDPLKNEPSIVALNKEDKEKFIKELSLSNESVSKINESKKDFLHDAPSKLARISSKVFGGLTDNLAKNSFSDLRKDLREANSRFLLTTYLAIALFCSTVVFFGSLIFIVGLTLIYPYSIMFIWIPFILAFLMIVGFYLYPSMEKANISKSISNELPFATIYMAAIAGSNIEPTKIFKIISDSPEYRNVGMEIRKVLNQVELYGYDLVTALKNVANTTSNKKLSELLNGMATNILSGGSLKNFLEKKSDNLLMDYRLDRQSYNAISETFMDIYISVLITAPLILVMLVVIMGITKLNIGSLSTETLIVGSIGLVIVINIFFLIFLQFKQPKT